jgi:2-oxoglutarate dehydrogenase E1 component
VVSPLADFSNANFNEILDDSTVKDAGSVTRAVVCTGKVYYDLLTAREQAKEVENVPLIRIEQLYPFNKVRFNEIMARYPNVKDVVWTQEEPINMGAWTFMRHRLEEFAQGKRAVRYVGRKGSGSTAEGSPKSHAMEQQRIVQEALGIAWKQDAKDASKK